LEQKAKLDLSGLQGDSYFLRSGELSFSSLNRENMSMSYVVIFRSTRKIDDGQLYSEWSKKMEQLVKSIDGYEHHFGFRDAVNREGVTISYFTSLEAIHQWKNLADHKTAQQLGRDAFYEEYSVQVCEVLKNYGFKAD
jgi:heme-degrading monooxygenase HmoA